MDLRWSLVLAAAAALALPGCCSLARALCPVEPALKQNTRLTRDDPDGSLDYLIEAFKDRRIADIYDSLHPDFRARYGDFSLAEFTSAFEEYEDVFRQDAGNLEAAARGAPRFDRSGLYGGIRVESGAMSALIVFKRRDVAFVKLNDEFVPESRAVIPPLGSMLQIEDGWLMPTQPVRFDGLQGVDPGAVTRLEYRQEWLVYELQDVRGVRFLERIEERF